MAAPAYAVEPTVTVDQFLTPEQSRQHAAELTPKAALVEPIGSLTLDTDRETLVPTPRH